MENDHPDMLREFAHANWTLSVYRVKFDRHTMSERDCVNLNFVTPGGRKLHWSFDEEFWVDFVDWEAFLREVIAAARPGLTAFTLIHPIVERYRERSAQLRPSEEL